MSADLRTRVAEALADTPWAGSAGELAAVLGERGEIAGRLAEAPDAVLRGVARAAASSAEAARFLAHRSALAGRIAALDPGWPRRRAAELDADAARGAADLEEFLDELRLLRREETLLAAILDLGGLVPFEEVSTLLSSLAEAIVRRTLARAREAQPDAPPLAVVAMGKLGGREFTYHSDLDLIFLYQGEPGALHPASRLAQRFIQYVSTMTGAGVAYAVDARLRPSGGQGTLVSSFRSFGDYQRREAATWEHLALVRARAVAGPLPEADAVLGSVRGDVFGGRDPWPEIESMRARVEAERADESRGIELKTGAGGLMDAEFLAQGAALECGEVPAPPGIPALLRSAARGPRVEELVSAYGTLRRVEARVRWLRGRAVERVERDPARLAEVAALVGPDPSGEALASRIEAAREVLRGAFRAVCKEGSIRALRG